MRKILSRLRIILAAWLEKRRRRASGRKGGLANRGKKLSALHKQHLREAAQRYKTLCPQPNNRRAYAPRFKHAPVDLVKAQRLYQNGATISEIVIAVKGSRASFDVRKLVRKTFRDSGILKPEDAPHAGRFIK